MLAWLCFFFGIFVTFFALPFLFKRLCFVNTFSLWNFLCELCHRSQRNLRIEQWRVQNPRWLMSSGIILHNSTNIAIRYDNEMIV